MPKSPHIVLLALWSVLASCPQVRAQRALPDPAVARMPSGPHALWQQLAADLAQWSAQGDGLRAASVVDLTTGQALHQRGDQVFAVASTIKLFIAAAAYAEAAPGGSLRLTESLSSPASALVDGSPVLSGLLHGTGQGTGTRSFPLRDLLHFMLLASDNTATNLLIDRVGMPTINRLPQRLGLSHTRLLRRMLDAEAVRRGDENTSTTAELATFLQRLYQRQVLSEAATADLLHLLQQPKAGFFAQALPDGLPIADKPGSLDGLRVDAALIFQPGRPYVLIGIAAFEPDGVKAERQLADLAVRTQRTFAVLATFTEHGRLRP
jgi:beta-lactamase class A